MIRFIGLNAFIALHSIVFCLWGILISLFDRSGRRVHFYCAAPWSKIILRACGVKVRVRGLENVEGQVPRIYMTNHQSYFDIFALLACLPVDFKFILKQELMKIPFLGQAMRGAGYISIDRNDPRKALKSMKEAAERIRSGASVLIFPEGTRSLDGSLLPFKPGGFRLALKSGKDIVPITIRGSHRIVPKGSLRIRKGSFSMSIGRPIRVGDYSKRSMEQLMARVREIMLRQMEAGEK